MEIADRISAEALLQRIDERREKLGLSERQVAQAGGNEYVIRDLRKRGSIPSADKLSGIARVLDVSVDWLIGKSQSLAPIEPIVLSDATRGFRHDFGGPANLPILGTAHGSAMRIDDNGGGEVETTIFEPGDVIRMIVRPPVLAGRNDVYALYIQGESMSPRHEPGDLVVVDPAKPPAIGDDVIVQLAEQSDDDRRIVSVLIKRLVRRSASYIELEQYQPAARFRLPSDRVAHVHRIVRLADLFGA